MGGCFKLLPMKVVFLKDHDPHRRGDTAELEAGLANYLVSVGVARPDKEKVEKAGEPEKETAGPATKKEITPKKEKVEKSAGKEKVEK